MEPMGIERHRRSPQGERTGASEWSQRDTVRHRRSKAEVADQELGSSSQSIEAQAQATDDVGANILSRWNWKWRFGLSKKRNKYAVRIRVHC